MQNISFLRQLSYIHHDWLHIKVNFEAFIHLQVSIVSVDFSTNVLDFNITSWHKLYIIRILTKHFCLEVLTVLICEMRILLSFLWSACGWKENCEMFTSKFLEAVKINQNSEDFDNRKSRSWEYQCALA